MKYDKKVNIIKSEKVSDGMGGWLENEPRVEKEIYTFLTPMKAELLLKEYGLASTTMLKLFTKDTIPIMADGRWQDVKVEVDATKQQYSIIQYADFGKVRMLLLEVSL